MNNTVDVSAGAWTLQLNGTWFEQMKGTFNTLRIPSQHRIVEEVINNSGTAFDDSG